MVVEEPLAIAGVLAAFVELSEALMLVTAVLFC
jgi:hypothetical protein